MVEPDPEPVVAVEPWCPLGFRARVYRAVELIDCEEIDKNDRELGFLCMELAKIIHENRELMPAHTALCAILQRILVA
jgi:hypothetical protein